MCKRDSKSSVLISLTGTCKILPVFSSMGKKGYMFFYDLLPESVAPHLKFFHNSKDFLIVSLNTPDL